MKKAILVLIKGYQKVRVGRMSPCRYYPSCSTYALEAVEVHGAAKGLWMATKRVSRCNPFGGSGFDPVPEAKIKKVVP